MKAAVIHGNKSQGARTRALADFKAAACRALVATDIAARGLDIVQLPLVVNFDLPLVPQDYIHRVGRTGRAGLAGRAVSLVSGADRELLRDIQRLLPDPIEQVLVARLCRTIGERAHRTSLIPAAAGFGGRPRSFGGGRPAARRRAARCAVAWRQTKPLARPGLKTRSVYGWRHTLVS